MKEGKEEKRRKGSGKHQVNIGSHGVLAVYTKNFSTPLFFPHYFPHTFFPLNIFFHTFFPAFFFFLLYSLKVNIDPDWSALFGIRKAIGCHADDV